MPVICHHILNKALSGNVLERKFNLCNDAPVAWYVIFWLCCSGMANITVLFLAKGAVSLCQATCDYT